VFRCMQRQFRLHRVMLRRQPLAFASMTSVPTLQTRHLDLCPWTDESAALFVAAHSTSSPERYSAVNRNAHWNALGYGSLAVFEHSTGEFVGAAGIELGGWPQEPDGWWGTPELSVSLLPKFQHRRLGQELGEIGLQWAFEIRQPPLDAVIAVTTPENVASEAVMRKVGMRKTSRILDARTDVPENERIAVVVYELSRNDYERSINGPGYQP
jgi:RimJ/RimL family protein N-acetyltransferase